MAGAVCNNFSLAALFRAVRVHFLGAPQGGGAAIAARAHEALWFATLQEARIKHATRGQDIIMDFIVSPPKKSKATRRGFGAPPEGQRLLRAMQPVR